MNKKIWLWLIVMVSLVSFISAVPTFNTFDNFEAGCANWTTTTTGAASVTCAGGVVTWSIVADTKGFLNQSVDAQETDYDYIFLFRSDVTNTVYQSFFNRHTVSVSGWSIEDGYGWAGYNSDNSVTWHGQDGATDLGTYAEGLTSDAWYCMLIGHNSSSSTTYMTLWTNTTPRDCTWDGTKDKSISDAINLAGYSVGVALESGGGVGLSDFVLEGVWRNGTAPVVPPYVPPPINLTIDYPAQNGNLGSGLNKIWINATHNATGAWSTTINDSKWTLDSNTSTKIYFVNNTAISSGTYHLRININKSVNSSNGTAMTYFYVDIVDPAITTIFSNGTVFYNVNLTGNFNFTDDFSLFSYNITVDGSTIFNKSNLNVALYQFNLSYDISALSVGQHTLKTTIADGHTAKYARNAERITHGVFNNYLKYYYDDVEIKISSGLFDSFTTNKEYDRYTFNYNPLYKLDEYEFEVESDKEIFVMDMPNTPWKKWLVVGDHWIDFYMDEELETVIEQPNPFKVKVKITGDLQEKEILEFHSVGDLNIIEQAFTFNTLALSVTNQSSILENSIADYTLNLTKDDSSISTNALFLFNGVYDGTIVKTASDYSDLYTVTVSHPLVSTYNTTIPYNWTYNFSSGSTNYYQSGNVVVHRMLLGNCNASFNDTALRFNVKNANTAANVTGFSFEADFSVWNADNNSFKRTYGFENLTVSHFMPVCIKPNLDNFVSDYDALFSHPLYDDTHYIVGGGILNSTTNTITVNLVNSTLATGITINIVDENDNELTGYIIEAWRYNLGTGDYTLITTQYSDSNGQALVFLDVTTYEYRFIVKNPSGTIVHTEPKQKLISTSYTFRVFLSTIPEVIAQKMLGLNIGLDKDRTAKTFNLSWDSINYITNKIRLQIIRLNSTADNVVLSTQYSTADTGSLGYFISEPTINVSASYVANVYVNSSDDGEWYFITSESLDYKKEWDIFGTESIIMTFLFVGTMIFIGLAVSAEMAIILTIVGMGFAWALGLFFVSLSGIVPLFVGLIIWLMRMRR